MSGKGKSERIEKTVEFPSWFGESISVKDYLEHLDWNDSDCIPIKDFGYSTWQINRDGEILNQNQRLRRGESVVIEPIPEK